MDNLVPIGRFSKMTRLSIKALRLYDELGLLQPDHVDPDSGYRYYRPGQANRAEAIRILRVVDMPLDDIAEVLAAPDRELVDKYLTRHRERLEAQLADRARMLEFLGRLIEREGGIMPYEVAVKQVAAQEVAAVKKYCSTRTVGSEIQQGFTALMMYLGKEGVAPAGPPFIVYHEVIDDQTAGDIEICMPVARPVAGDGDVYGMQLAGGAVATTVHQGPYDEIGPAYHTLTGWIQEHGHEIAGPPREIYLNDPRSVAPEDILTELDFPIS